MFGNKKQEGGAVNVNAPAATPITFGELYRIDGWTGFSMRTISANDTERGFALDISDDVYYVQLPSGLAAVRGALLYWASAGVTFQQGNLNLQATAGTGPVVKVEEAVDANGVAAVKLLEAV